VAVLARTASECEEAARAAGPGSFPVVCDVSDAAACGVALENIHEALGRVQIVVHAAGISPVRARAEHHEPEVFRNIVDVNVAGTFNVVHASAPQLLDGGGAVVLVASVLGVIGSERLAGYGASKAALVHLARTLGREWAPRAVRVNAVCAGYVPTAMTDQMLRVDRIREDLVARIPLGRLATLDEIVAPILYLASDSASYVTGTCLIADGGMSA
jgi:3-oxoacyl-[acyl-carrier protein] reductase